MPEQMMKENPLMNTYKRFPIAIVKGEGSYVWDERGRKYLDFTSGIGVCNLGHVPPVVKNALYDQLEILWHCSNLYHIPQQDELAQLLVNHSFADQVFFCNSGAEANEAAIKLARRYTQKIKNSNAYEIITFKKSFHGRTLATLTATGQEKVQDGFAPLVEGFRYLPYNDDTVLEKIDPNKTAAVMLEVVQGEGGVLPADRTWLQALAEFCKENDILLIVDEVQTGMGRTGKLFAYEHYNIAPDMMTLAKGLGSGFPIGAMLATEKVAKAFSPGTHATTFGGNPLAATAGVATIKEMTSDDFLTAVANLGDYFSSELMKLKEKHPVVKEVRGIGLMQGIVIDDVAINYVTKAQEEGILLLVAGENVIRLLPPLTTNKQEIDHVITVLDKLF